MLAKSRYCICDIIELTAGGVTVKFVKIMSLAVATANEVIFATVCYSRV